MGILSSFFWVLAGTPANAQLNKGSVEIGAVGGASLPVTWFRAKDDRRLVMGSFQVGRVMTHPRGPRPLAGSVELLLEVTPLIAIEQPDRTFGFAASPLHVRWNLAPWNHGRGRLFAEVSGGLLHTGQPVPARTTTFNFIDQAGFGVRFERTPRFAWLAGYRFQHISNGGRIRPNPGLNFNFAYAGFSVLP